MSADPYREMPGADPDAMLDPDATVSGHEGVSAATVAQYELRRRLLRGDEEGVDIVERLRFHAERSWYSSVHVTSALMEEAAAMIEESRS